MRSEWKEGTIGEVCLTVTDGSHTSPKSVSVGQYMVSVKDFTPSGFNFLNCRQISEIDYLTLKKNGCVPQFNDILIGKDGARFFEDIIIYRQPESPALLSSIAILRCNEQIILPDFLFYILKSPDFKKDVRGNYGSGSAIPRIILKDFKRMPIRYPDISIQRAISETLSCLDDKIELNNRINKNLEAQAQAIFKSWFVDFEPFQDGEFVESEMGLIPNGWSVGTLSDVSTITMGQSPSGSSYNENGIGTVFYQGCTDFGELFPDRRLFTTEPKRMALKSDILLSVRAPVGDYNIATEQCCIGRGLSSIHPNSFFYSFCICLMRFLQPHFDKFNGEGTVFGSINKNSLNELKIIIPTCEIVENFEQVTIEFWQQILIGFTQNQTLSALRDTLLPKLMNGEIQIPQEV